MLRATIRYLGVVCVAMVAATVLCWLLKAYDLATIFGLLTCPVVIITATLAVVEKVTRPKDTRPPLPPPYTGLDSQYGNYR